MRTSAFAEASELDEDPDGHGLVDVIDCGDESLPVIEAPSLVRSPSANTDSSQRTERAPKFLP